MQASQNSVFFQIITEGVQTLLEVIKNNIACNNSGSIRIILYKIFIGQKLCFCSKKKEVVEKKRKHECRY